MAGKAVSLYIRGCVATTTIHLKPAQVQVGSNEPCPMAISLCTLRKTTNIVWLHQQIEALSRVTVLIPIHSYRCQSRCRTEKTTVCVCVCVWCGGGGGVGCIQRNSI